MPRRPRSRSVIPMVIALAWSIGASQAPAARAGLITYEFTGTLSGSLGGVAFTDAPVLFHLTADTAAITSTGSGPGSVPFTQTFLTAAAPLDFTIDGVSGTFSDLLRVFALTFAPFGLPGPAIGSVGLSPQGPNNSNDLLDVRNTSLALYDLATPFGPLTQEPPDFINPGEAYPTTDGDLILEEGDADSLTFRAFAAVAVPEPSSAALLATATLAASGVLAWPRRRGRVGHRPSLN